MERKFLKELGLEDEQIEQIMKQNGQDVGKTLEKAKAEAAAATAAEMEKLKADSAELERLRKQSMSAEELTKKALADADAERVRYLKMQGEAKATTILAKAGMAEDALGKILPALVTDDLAETEQRATDYAMVFSTAIEAACRAKEEELLKRTPEPPAANGAPNPGADVQKKLEEASAAGDMASVAYWTRVAQQKQGG